MKKTALLTAGLLLAGNAYAFNEAPLASHDVKIVSEHRDHFSRNYMQLDSNFGMVGKGLLLTSLEYHSWAKDNGAVTDLIPDVPRPENRINSVDSLFAPGFMYFMPLSQKFFVGPAAKLQFDDGHRSWLKAGVAAMYQHGNGLYAMGMYRFDRGLSSEINRDTYNASNMDRKDILVGYKSAKWDTNLRVSHFHLVKSGTKQLAADLGHSGEFAEAELIAEYKGYNNFSPFASVIWESRNKYANPTAFGNNGFSVGVKIHF